MAITFDGNDVTIVDGEYSFEDIYQASIDAGNDVVSKLSSTYVFKNNVTLGDKETYTKLSDKNKTIIVNGDSFQLLREATLELGEIRSNGSTLNGCFLDIPNIKFKYGFGDVDKNDPGCFIAYNSKINIFGFWSFFGGSDTKVILKDCYLDAMGRIEGKDSILENLNFKRSHGRYGILSPKGTLKRFKNLNVENAKKYTKNDVDYYGQIYYNAGISGDMIVDGGKFRNYDPLIFCEKSSGNLTLLDIDFDNKITRFIPDDNESTVDLRYSFNPFFVNNKNETLEVNVKITDADDNVIVEEDVDGKLESQLIFGAMDKSQTEFTKLYPFNIRLEYTIDDETIVSNKKYALMKPFLDLPIYLDANGGSDDSSDDSGGGCSCEDIQDKIDKFENKMKERLNDIESGIKQVVREVTDEVNENETYIKETGFSVIV